MKKLLPILFLITACVLRGQELNLSHPISDKTAVISTWDEIESPVNGFARVLKGSYFTFINSTGKPITSPIFTGARNFNNQLAAVSIEEKWGFLATSGKLVVPCEYDVLFDFKQSVTVGLKNKKWMLIDKKGMVLKNLDIDVCFGFKDSKASVEKEGKKGILSIDGKIVWDNNTNNNAARSNATIPVNSASNGNCPDNLDFEFGNFTNWRCFTGRVDSIGTTNVITVSPSAAVTNRHRIIGRSTPSAVDFFGLFPTNPPDGSNYCVKLGNTNIGAQAERISYTIHVPTNDSNFSVKYDYAVVFQDPGHTSWSQPRFTARLFDSATNAYVNCASFEYISTSNLPGFTRSTVDTSVIYKNWSSVFISLRQYAGRTLYLEFTTADCVRRGHWGYAYVDVEPSCGRSISANYSCNYPNITVLDAPPGFQTYNWWNGSFTSILATGQNAVLNPGPSTNANLWLEMIPYNSFGCRDTMSVALTTTYTPSFSISETNAACAPRTITFINNDAPSNQVTWNFGDGTTGFGDSVSHTYTTPGTYIITMNATVSGGCNGSVRDTITISSPSATLNYTGGNHCGSTNTSLSVTATGAVSFLWNFGDGSVQNTSNGSITHTYSTAGTYTPSVTVNFGGGCTLILNGSTTISVNQVVPAFNTSLNQRCGSTTVAFQNLSTPSQGVNTFYWSFGDGQSATGFNTSHVYVNSGNYRVTLRMVSNSGCVDSISQNIQINVWKNPIVGISSVQPVCLNQPVVLNANTSSGDSIATMSWVTSNGYTAAGSNTANFTFSSADTFLISFIASTVNGCSDTANQFVLVKPIPVLTQPGNQQLCNGVLTSLVGLASSLSGTMFSWTNDLPAIGLPVSGTGNIPAFTATNDTDLVISANITIQASYQGCNAVPVGFTYTVYPTPQSIQPANQVVCNRAATAPVIVSSFNSAVASNSYIWTNNLPSIGLSASGTGNIPSFAAINNTTQPQTATITMIARENGCEAIPAQFTITVNPTPQMQPPAATVVCNGTLIPAINFSGTTGADSYHWTNDQPSIGLSASGTGSIGSFAGINTTSVPVTANLSVYPSLNGCSGDMHYFQITANPTPTVNRPADQSVCLGSPITAINFSGPVSGTRYNWTNSTPGIGLATSGTGNIPSFNPVNNGMTTVSSTLTVTPDFNGCPGLPQQFVISVMPMADLVQPLNQIICNGVQTSTINFNGTLSNASYSWTNNNSSIGLANAGTGSIPAFTAINTTNISQVATITVAAAANGCPGNTRSFAIHIDPTPDMVQPISRTVCAGSRIDSLVFTSTVAGTSFSWINSQTQIGLPANGQGSMPAFTANNPNNYPITATISVVGLANSCNSVSRTFTLTVNPSAAADSVPDQSVCNGAALASISLTSPIAGTQLRWTNDQPSIGLPAAGIGNIPSFLATNTTNATILANIRVLAESNNQCSAEITTFKIAVNPTPTIRAGNNQTVCKGNLINLTATGANTYNWYPSTGLSCTGCANPQLQAEDNITYIVEGMTGAGCRGMDTIQLNVIQPFSMLAAPNDTICSGKQVQLYARNADRYLWYPSAGLNNANIANPVASPNTTTMYTVVGYDASHCFTDTAQILITVGPIPTVQAGADIQVATGTQVVLTPNITNGPVSNISWTPSSGLSCNDCLHPVLTVTQNTSYVISVENRFGCKAVDSLKVLAFCKNAQVFIPNAFTPDGDGFNDVLMVRGTGITVKSFRIFNRWGNLVFEKQYFSPNDPKYGWDGRVKGVPSSPDVFVYIAEVVCDNGTPYMYKGNVTIIK